MKINEFGSLDVFVAFFASYNSTILWLVFCDVLQK